ncbi:inositol monophosphatase [Corynebacterium pseudotuberculosis]|uniref:Inositol-1-monophosphatase n=1 Tax=Corynebacterium pseudotuberculosis 258 TaxID=1168865 RepID=A0AAU8PM14_CORPS|nr:inositol monophosphatase family protein [Corynebacterium pseudotuberculosis]AEQ06760.1 inositol monophosphatase [Corynebacterium pseudotuberculosis CIP 52.97]AFB72561.1 inositol monophosphatase [Corynebacterium pseudotuberculosis 316]AFH52160.1 Inositol-1-monophosphatase [Corynebacterium pseudotuberculosis 267]AFH91028.1 inositol monophosphatase [Corynebacterium pseudotuberculosis 31]AFK16853.1 inositol monophosphatase [Corynebacterium pseudotuberculosis 258]
MSDNSIRNTNPDLAQEDLQEGTACALVEQAIALLTAEHDTEPNNAVKLAGDAIAIANCAAVAIKRQVAQLEDISSFVQTKSSPVDPVTIVDTEAERIITEEITRRRPSDGIIGEEGSDRVSVSGVTWIVDPIDGTVNFLYGIPHYAVSVAAAIDGQAVAGAVVNVATGRMYAAAAGAGAIATGEDGDWSIIGIRYVNDLATALVATGFSYKEQRRKKQAELLVRVLPQVRDIRRMGSAALDLCSVAEGKIDAYFEHGLNSWDYAAGALIATEAGAVARIPALSTPGASGEILWVSSPNISMELEKVLTSYNVQN